MIRETTWKGCVTFLEDVFYEYNFSSVICFGSRRSISLLGLPGFPGDVAHLGIFRWILAWCTDDQFAFRGGFSSYDDRLGSWLCHRCGFLLFSPISFM